MKKKQLFTATRYCLVALLLLAHTACTEDTLLTGSDGVNPTEKFFSSTAAEGPEIKKIKDDLRQLNSSQEFVSRFTEHAGYPRWDKAIPLDQGAAYIIPVTSATEEHITGALTVDISRGGFSYRLAMAKDFRSYGSQQAAYLRAMMQLDARVYRYNTFRMKETGIFTNAETLIFREKKTAQKTTDPEEEEELDPCDIIEIWYDPDGASDPTDNSGNEYYTGEWYYAGFCPNGQLPPVYFLFNPGPGGGGGGYYTLPALTGLGGGGGIPYTPGTTMMDKYNYLTEQLFLNTQQQDWLTSHAEVIQLLYTYLYGHFTQARRDIAIWALNYLMQNPGTNLSTFGNQFLGYAEDQDTGYDILFWEDPNNTFAQQPLPGWSSFEAAFPSHTDPNYNTSEKMFLSIGGAVYSTGYTGPLSNTCAVRLSKALNYSGVTIPNIPNITYKGADNKYYFLGAANMVAWMKQTFRGPGGAPLYTRYTNADGGPGGLNFPALLANKKGIFGMLPNRPGGCNNGTGFCASGHVDIINNVWCDGGCFFSATGGVNEIYIWELQ